VFSLNNFTWKQKMGRQAGEDEFLSITDLAARWRCHRQIAAKKVRELGIPQMQKGRAILELVSGKLLEAYAAALRFEQVGAAVAAMTALAKLLGLNAPEKVDLSISMPSDRPLKRHEYSIEEWIAEFSPKEIEHQPAEPNGHDNGD
jgi:hypothetical protein